MSFAGSMRGSLLQRLLGSPSTKSCLPRMPSQTPPHHHLQALPTPAGSHHQRTPASPRCPVHLHALGTSSSSGSSGNSAADEMSAWDSTTNKLVALSAAPFSIIAMPQVWQNFAAISSGNAAALGIISWEGVSVGTMGNTLMGAHFASMGEGGALNVQLVSIVNNLLILSQVAYTGYMPAQLFVGAAVAAVMCAAANVSRANGWLPAGSDGSWRGFQMALGITGLALIPQVMSSVVSPGSTSLAPGAVALAAACAWLFAQSRSKSPKDFQSLVSALPGSAATLLFCLAPLPQLIKNFMDPSVLGGLSLGSLALALLGNSLMFPRALKTKDPIWLVGSVWANIAGWLTLLSLFLGRDAATGLSFVDVRVFGAITTVMVTFFGGVLMHDKKVKGHTSIFASVGEVFGLAKPPAGR